MISATLGFGPYFLPGLQATGANKKDGRWYENQTGEANTDQQ